jgi:transposase
MENGRRFFMAAAIGVRGDYTADGLRRLAKPSRDSKQTRRLLALAAIHDSASPSVAARIGGVGLQTVRDWVMRVNAEGPEGLIDRKAPGKRPLLTPARRRALAGAVEAGPRPYLDGVARWRLIDLVQRLWDELGISASRPTLGRELRAMGFARLSARRQHHAQAPEAIEEFKKLPRHRGGDPRRARPGQDDRDLVPGRGADRPDEQAHAPLGPARHPAPSAARPAHQVGLPVRRHLPEEGQGRRAGHALVRHPRDGSPPRRDQRHGRAGRPGGGDPRSGRVAHVEEAHGARQPHARPAATPRPRTQPGRELWQFLRENRLSNRVFQSYEDIVAHCCDAWNKLPGQTWRIITLGMRDWAHEF